MFNVMIWIVALIAVALATVGVWKIGMLIADRLVPGSHRSSVSKSVLWRLMGVLVLGGVTYFFTRHWAITTAITFVHHATFVVVFYLHERAWMKTPGFQGKVRNILKSFTYEIILGMGIGGLIVFAFTGQLSKVTHITGTYTAIKLIMYYLYDRAWKEFG